MSTTARPFTIAVPQARLDSIRERLAIAEVGYAPADDADWKYGTDAAYLADFRRYWLDHYDWRAAEAELNRLPQFTAAIDGLDIHFIHVRGDGGGGRLPLLLTHGWPGSVVEFQAAIPLLAAQGFDLVIPSLPGYGWSSRPASPIGPRAVAMLWRKLMVDVLGYRRFGAQGGDWGSGISIALGREHDDVVAAVHVNLLFQLPMRDASPALIAWRAEMDAILAREGAYMLEHRTRPQTIGLALAASPLGFAAWVLEKLNGWADTGGNIERRFTKDQLITNIMTYLVNDAVQSAIWLYHGSSLEQPHTGACKVPFGFASFPGEFVPPPPRADVERAFKLVRWTEMPSGGHFAAWEEPSAFAAEVGSFFRQIG
ncbi:MAG: epoxide hydrolase [Sphingomicrobium sp.]